MAVPIIIIGREKKKKKKKKKYGNVKFVPLFVFDFREGHWELEVHVDNAFQSLLILSVAFTSPKTGYQYSLSQVARLS